MFITGRKSVKRGTILVENVIFIVLNLVFLSVLFLFLFSRIGSAAVLEEKYAKQIALIIDAAKPGMKISLNMGDAIEKAEKELGKDKIDEAVKISDNVVMVKLRERGGYSYSFFNDVSVNSSYFSGNNLMLFIEEKPEI